MDRPSTLIVTREAGIVRCTRVDASQTEAAREREFQRRARQVPPRPNRSILKQKRHELWLRNGLDEHEPGGIP